MNTEEIMKLADTYVAACSEYENECNSYDSDLRYLSELQLVRDEDRAALEAALSAKQEPVATLTVRDDMGADIKFHQALTLLPWQTFALYTHPAPSVNAQESEIVLSRESFLMMGQRISELEAQNAQMLEALKKIATVNAMDYEYQRWAKAAIAAVESLK